MISGIIKVEADYICQDLDYSGYHKNLIQLLFSGSVQVLENLESPGVYSGIFQDWKVLKKGHSGPVKFWKSVKLN